MLRCVPQALLLVALATPVAAQLPRIFTQQTLRGDLAVTQPPDVRLNGKPARFSPGVRIRDENNRFVVWGSVAGRAAIVNYTLDANGELIDVWLLTPAERATPWPRSEQEARNWRFDPTTQSWSRP